MLLRLACPAADWLRLAAALEAAGSPILAAVVRAVLAAAPRPTATAPVALAFTPAQVGELQRVGLGLGLNLLATPVVMGPDPAGWVTSLAERAEAVAAAEVILRTRRRDRVS